MTTLKAHNTPSHHLKVYPAASISGGCARTCLPWLGPTSRTTGLWRRAVWSASAADTRTPRTAWRWCRAASPAGRHGTATHMRKTDALAKQSVHGAAATHPLLGAQRFLQHRLSDRASWEVRHNSVHLRQQPGSMHRQQTNQMACAMSHSDSECESEQWKAVDKTSVRICGGSRKIKVEEKL